MNIEAINTRISDHRCSQAAVKVQIDQLTANFHAIEGAIQECQHWLGQLGPSQDAQIFELVGAKSAAQE